MQRKARTVPALEARTHFGEIMKRVSQAQERVIVEKAGIPLVAIISIDEYRRLIAEREERFKVFDTIREKLPELPEEEVEQDVARAISEIRGEYDKKNL